MMVIQEDYLYEPAPLNYDEVGKNHNPLIIDDDNSDEDKQRADESRTSSEVKQGQAKKVNTARRFDIK